MSEKFNLLVQGMPIRNQYAAGLHYRQNLQKMWEMTTINAFPDGEGK